MEWSRNDVCTLINSFREKRMLWDPTNPSFKDRSKKHDAWDEISREMSLSRSEVEKKMRSLIGQFQRELKKQRCESGADHGKESKWFGYNLLLFLKDKNNVSCQSREVDFRDNSSERNFQEQRKLDDEIIILNVSSQQSKKSPQQPVCSSNPSKCVSKRKSSPTEEQVYSIVKRLSSNMQEKDEFDIFGEYVALTIRNLKSKYDQATAKYRISNILYEMEID